MALLACSIGSILLAALNVLGLDAEIVDIWDLPLAALRSAVGDTKSSEQKGNELHF